LRVILLEILDSIDLEARHFSETFSPKSTD
jgi:hypothetical protein